MAAVVETSVAFGDDELTIVRYPGDLIGGREDGTVLPGDITSVLSAKVFYADGGDIGLWDGDVCVNAIQAVADAEVIVENGVWARLRGYEGGDWRWREELFNLVNGVKVTTTD